MRERLGNAAAAAARCRNCRRGSFTASSQVCINSERGNPSAHRLPKTTLTYGRRPLELRLQRATLIGGIERRIVVGEGPRALDVQRAKYGSLLAEHVRDLLLERGQLRKVIALGVAGGARQTGEIDLWIGDRVAAVGLVAAIVAHEMHKILRRNRADRDEAAEVHQQAAVAVEHDDALVGPR